MGGAADMHPSDMSTLLDIKTDEIQLLYPGRPQWDIPKLARFGDRPLTPQLVWKSMEGVREPMASAWWCFLMFVALSIVTPLTAQLQPPLDTEGLTGNTFLYPPPVVNGLPWWAFKSLMMCLLTTLLLLGAIMRMPNDFPINETKIEKEGIDPDIVEMTMEEMNTRTSYDSRNDLIHQRRSSIAQTMEELGFVDVKSETMVIEPTPSQRKLAALALQSSRRLGIVENDKKMVMVKEDAPSAEEMEPVSDDA